MDRTPPGESLPPSQDDIDISRADLETAADAAGHFGCDQARTRTEKRVTRSGLKGTRIASPSFRALRAPGRRTVSRLTLLPPLAPAAMHCGHRQHSVSHAKPRYGGASERRSVHLHGPPMVEFAPDSLLEGNGFELPVPRGRFYRDLSFCLIYIPETVRRFAPASLVLNGRACRHTPATAPNRTNRAG